MILYLIPYFIKEGIQFASWNKIKWKFNNLSLNPLSQTKNRATMPQVKKKKIGSDAAIWHSNAQTKNRKKEVGILPFRTSVRRSLWAANGRWWLSRPDPTQTPSRGEEIRMKRGALEIECLLFFLFWAVCNSQLIFLTVCEANHDYFLPFIRFSYFFNFHWSFATWVIW